jgi:AcrR family transcriptional regulator
METTSTAIIEKAAQIVMKSGLEGLTVRNLATELEVKDNQLYKQITKDDDILQILLFGFEADIIEFIKELDNKDAQPETELKLLFKGLYFLFLQKPYYLAIIFDKSLKNRGENIKHSFLRIKSIAEQYLAGVINKGKKQNTFKTNEPTKLLVNRILSEFRIFMKDEQRLNEMILELKTMRTLND